MAGAMGACSCEVKEKDFAGKSSARWDDTTGRPIYAEEILVTRMTSRSSLRRCNAVQSSELHIHSEYQLD